MWKYLPEKIQMRLTDRYDCTNDARIWSVVLNWYDSIEKTMQIKFNYF